MESDTQDRPSTSDSTRGRKSSRSEKAAIETEVESDTHRDKPNKKTRQRKALSKTQKKSVVDCLSCLHNTTLSILAMVGVSNQLPLPCEDLKDFCDCLPVSDIEFFTEHLKERFVTLYDKYATLSAASDRYLQF